MNNYRFNKAAAQTQPTPYLFKVLLCLVQLQYSANLYRQGVTCTELRESGICGSLERLMKVHAHQDLSFPWLADVFFKSSSYPVTPYSPSVWFDTDHCKAFRWGHNPRGDKRMRLLEQMITDLTKYLTNEAV